MKLNTQRKSVQSAGMSINVDFSIDMNGKAFSVLSKDMYSDIHTTIVRELSSNAYDAHVAAGKADVPFEVSCPSAFDPHFAVKDFGIGLRYLSYNANIVNEHDGESTIFIDGDVRDEIEGINLIVLDQNQTVNIGAALFDNTEKKTVLRIPGNFSGTDVPVEFDDTLVLYSTYFRSTKEQTNEMTGAFGLGSKTPLAYTDNFIVTNRYNGTERVYNILTNADGMPQINLMMSGETDEGNGLEVKLAVSPDDYSTFKEAIASQLKYFDPQPTVMNDPVTFPKLVHKGEHFMLFENLSDYCQFSYSNSHACVGNNAYEISYVDNRLFRDDLCLRFAIGEVMVTASREDLQYDEDTRTLIKQREREAFDEYSSFVMEQLDDDSMSDFEKVEFLNSNFHVIDLKSQKVRNKVGNPNLHYTKNKIDIPLSGWGGQTELRWVDIEKDDGTVVTKLASHGHFPKPKLRWSEFSSYKNKTSRLNSNVYIDINESKTVFIRDNNYSFLKKIGYYAEENDIDRGSILTLDSWDDDSLEALKEVAGDRLEFVYLSDIELPKTIRTSAYGSYTTPVARLYTENRTFDSSKYWDDVYTPLTKIDTDAYIVETHRCDIEMESNDFWFMRYFLNYNKLDEDVTILALSRARYAKALTYGFKPIEKLVKKLRKTVTIPVDMVNRAEMLEMQNKINRNDVLKRCLDMKDDIFEMLDEDSPIRTLLRVKKLYYKRYQENSNKYRALEDLLNHMDGVNKPEPSSFVKDTVDSITEMCDNVSNELLIVSNLDSWDFRRKEELQKAVVKYINTTLNTGEKK